MRAVLIAIAIARVAGVSSTGARADAPAPLIPVEAPDSEYPDPLASLTHRFSLAQPGSGAGKAPLPKWLEKPPWWLPTPPEWGPPPAHMYGSWYDPRNIPQVRCCCPENACIARSVDSPADYVCSPSSGPTHASGDRASMARVASASAGARRRRRSAGTGAPSPHSSSRPTQARMSSLARRGASRLALATQCRGRRAAGPGPDAGI